MADVFQQPGIRYEKLAYEDFTANYEATIDHILARCGVPAAERIIPERPMKKVSKEKNEEFREMFLKLIGGEFDPMSGSRQLDDTLSALNE